MAITANVNTSITVTDSATAFKASITPASLSVTLSAVGRTGGVQNIATTAENVDYGDLTSAQVGYAFFQNLDSTNYIDLGQSDTGTIKPIVRLKAGEFAVFRITASQQLMAQANTAACNLYFEIFRD